MIDSMYQVFHIIFQNQLENQLPTAFTAATAPFSTVSTTSIIGCSIILFVNELITPNTACPICDAQRAEPAPAVKYVHAIL